MATFQTASIQVLGGIYVYIYIYIYICVCVCVCISSMDVSRENIVSKPNVSRKDRI